MVFNKNKASKQIKSRHYSKLKYLENPEAKKKRAREIRLLLNKGQENIPLCLIAKILSLLNKKQGNIWQ